MGAKSDSPHLVFLNLRDYTARGLEEFAVKDFSRMRAIRIFAEKKKTRGLGRAGDGVGLAARVSSTALCSYWGGWEQINQGVLNLQ